MGTHESRLIAVNKNVTTQSCQEWLESRNQYMMKDGIQIAKILRGRSREGINDDSSFVNIFKNGWQIELKKLSSRIGHANAARSQKVGESPAIGSIRVEMK